MIVFIVSVATAITTALVCIVVMMQDTRRLMRICERERRRTEALLQQHGRLLVPVQTHAQAKGVDIEDLLRLCGAEGWSETGGESE